MMFLSLVLAAGVVATVGLRGEEASETATLSAESPNPETTAKEQRQSAPDRAKDRPAKEQSRQEQPRQEQPRQEQPRQEQPRQEQPRQEQSRQEPAPPKEQAESPPTIDVDWPAPKADEVASANEPRNYEPVSGTDMTLTIEALGLYDAPVISSGDLSVLDKGLMHEPETSLPWDSGAQRNVFIAGHYLGYPETGSRLIFYNLDKLKSGDEIVVEDSRGNAYKYRVSESFAAGPDESWVMGQVRNRDMLTLQTCIPPDFRERLIVRADRI